MLTSPLYSFDSSERASSTSSSQKPCENPSLAVEREYALVATGGLTATRFLDTEKWRKETKLDETVPTWDYPEKAEISKYYTQFYHKTDKV